MSANDQQIEFLMARVFALEKALSDSQKTLLEISEVSTKKARDIKVIISDPNFDRPISNLERNYGN